MVCTLVLFIFYAGVTNVEEVLTFPDADPYLVEDKAFLTAVTTPDTSHAILMQLRLTLSSGTLELLLLVDNFTWSYFVSRTHVRFVSDSRLLKVGSSTCPSSLGPRPFPLRV